MANTKVADLLPSSALTGTELFYADNGVNDVKVTSNQIKNFIIINPFPVGANVSLSTSGLFIGNASVNSVSNSSAIKIGNYILGNTGFDFGNSTANVRANSTIVTLANSSGVANIQPTQITVGGNFINTSRIQIGANTFLGPSTLSIGNSSVNLLANSTILTMRNATAQANLLPTQFNIGANVYMNVTSLQIGNSSVNTVANNNLLRVRDATGGSANVGPLVASIGNSSVYTTIGATTRTVVGSNSFTLGTSAVAANGYTWLFNGVLLQWGWIAANSSVGNITFPAPFPTNIFSRVVTSNSTLVGDAVIIFANTTVMNVRTTNTAYVGAAQNTWWFAIGN